MDKFSESLWRSLNGTSEEEFFRETQLEDLTKLHEKQLFSHFPEKIVYLGHSQEDEYLTQEDREAHIHILGAPGEGKSKFLELLIRSDIQNGYGACLLDPSENGDTAFKVLKYCCQIGFEKVCLINPIDFLEKVPVFNPLKYNAPATVSVGNVMDALQVLWNTKNFAETPRIQKYATALLHSLHSSQSTLVESGFFLARNQYQPQREHILSSLPYESLHRAHLTSAYQTLLTFEQFQSTVNRFGVFQDPMLRLVLGSKKPGIPFTKLISEGWLILVNLDPQSVWGTEQIQQRLLGTLLINEITYAIHRLNSNQWRGSYFLYIDEVGDYATSKLAYLLDKKRKTGLRLCLAHQRFEQIEDRSVQSSIRGSAKTKALFYTPNKQDRDIMMRDMGYGGELPDRQVSYVLGELKKQHAALRIGKRPPVIVRLKDIPDVEISGNSLKDFKQKIYSQDYYYETREINNEINARFTQTQPSYYMESRGERKPPENKRRSNLRTPADYRPGSSSFLQGPKRRSTRKVDKVQSPPEPKLRANTRLPLSPRPAQQDGEGQGTHLLPLSTRKKPAKSLRSSRDKETDK